MKSRSKGALVVYAERRDAALIHFVKTGDDSKYRAVCRTYNMPIPRIKDAFHAGMYKAVRYCTNIPEDIKKQAWDKCIALGFVPYIPEYEALAGAGLMGGERHAAD